MKEEGKQRFSTRYDLNLELDIKRAETENTLFQKCQTRNVSNGGFFLVCSNELATVGEVLNFQIIRAVHPHLSGKAIVRWSNMIQKKQQLEQGLGLEIIDFTSTGERKSYETLVTLLGEEKE